MWVVDLNFVFIFFFFYFWVVPNQNNIFAWLLGCILDSYSRYKYTGKESPAFGLCLKEQGLRAGRFRLRLCFSLLFFKFIFVSISVRVGVFAFRGAQTSSLAETLGSYAVQAPNRAKPPS